MYSEWINSKHQEWAGEDSPHKLVRPPQGKATPLVQNNPHCDHSTQLIHTYFHTSPRKHTVFSVADAHTDTKCCALS